jgi:hypothetical protein
MASVLMYRNGMELMVQVTTKATTIFTVVENLLGSMNRMSTYCSETTVRNTDVTMTKKGDMEVNHR